MKRNQTGVHPKKIQLNKKEATRLINTLQLIHHPEGGWYREVYRSDEIIGQNSLPERYSVPHCYSTSIYFLLESDDFSAFHRIASDETWHFYKGSPVTLFIISGDGALNTVTMGSDVEKGHILQYTIIRDCWFAAKTSEDSSYSLVGCTVAPGFEFHDFELADRKTLMVQYPDHSEIIKTLTRIYTEFHTVFGHSSNKPCHSSKKTAYSYKCAPEFLNTVVTLHCCRAFLRLGLNVFLQLSHYS